MDKKTLRHEARARRDVIPDGVRAEASRVIAQRVSETAAFRNASRIALFASIGSEVDTRPIEEAAAARHAITCYPRVEPAGIVFYDARASELVPAGRMAIPEPPPGAPASGAIDLVIVPGLAFDEQKHRLGYGGGYYDTYLARSMAATIAVAFEAQIVESVPVNDRDLAPQTLVTEARVR